MIRLVAGWLSSIALGLLVVGPLAALGVCALVDRGPGGEARASLFPVAVAALDPYVWTCLRNSATTAGLATLASMVAGVAIGRLIGDRGFPFRALALALLAAVAATPPVALALGASSLVEANAGPAWAGLLERAGSASRILPSDWAWLAWLGAAVLPGAAIAALAYATALDRLDPSWRDAAVLAGGAGTRGWRRLAWPLLRPEMGRVGGLVFAATLADPGPPLVLGLRRSLGYQLVTTAFDDEPFPRLAVLGLIAVIICAAARTVLRLWTGPSRRTITLRRDPAGNRERSVASRARTLAVFAAMGILAVLAAAPLVGLATTAPAGAILPRLSDPAMGRIFVRSLVLGLAVAALTAVSDRVVGWFESSAGGAASGRFRRLARAAAPPPLVAGVVTLALGRLLRLWLAAYPEAGRSASAPAALAEWLAGDRLPLAAATLAVWLATVSARLDDRREGDASGAVPARSRQDGRVEAGRGRARRRARASSYAGRWRAAAATIATAAVNVAPAVLLASSTQAATIGPAVLLLRERPEAGTALAATLAAVVWIASVAAAFLDPVARRIASTPGASRD
ncbi:hypothetical protein [Paludisphaera mucosa]|uniref:ABC transmembrane type-1 domain-containing protein n=1 Tax=Paludisphaera mucosa TaxID=3030827 RepID=A0ABT6FGM3_9BACT|nr:hypothetical protein [Paludisphaera mucosa]MDG3006553.1 hypothetical protein [Paludisphaera mucosa]